MLASALTESAAVFVVVIAGAFIVSAWGFVDLLRRPSLACRIAHVSKIGWLLLLGLSLATIFTSFLGMLYVAPANPGYSPSRVS